MLPVSVSIAAVSDFTITRLDSTSEIALSITMMSLAIIVVSE